MRLIPSTILILAAACGGCTRTPHTDETGHDTGDGVSNTSDGTGTTGEGPGGTERAGMMQVPAGAFWRGCNAVLGDHCETEANGDVLYNIPYRELELSEFWIDKYEVTVEEYGACGAADACTAPNGVPWGDVAPPDVPNLPITGVSWVQADAYCAWRGKRLPTEAEWEKAARGTDGRRWPWGNEHPSCGQAHLLLGDECERIRHALPVDAHPGDVSPYGVIGMIGNVQEWVQDWAVRAYYDSCPAVDPPGPQAPDVFDDLKVVRGGYWDAYSLPGNTSVSVSQRRFGRLANGSQGRIGLRCASSQAPP